MTSWEFPLIHVYEEVPFSSVSQVLFIILGSKPPYHHRRGVLGITISNLKRNKPPRAKNSNIGYTGGYIVHDIIIGKTAFYTQQFDSVMLISL